MLSDKVQIHQPFHIVSKHDASLVPSFEPQPLLVQDNMIRNVHILHNIDYLHIHHIDTVVIVENNIHQATDVSVNIHILDYLLSLLHLHVLTDKDVVYPQQQEMLECVTLTMMVMMMS